MRIHKETIEAKSRPLIRDWSIEYEMPTILHGQEIDDLFYIKYFVPWAKTLVTVQTLYDWCIIQMMSNEITRKIDKEILEVLLENNPRRNSSGVN